MDEINLSEIISSTSLLWLNLRMEFFFIKFDQVVHWHLTIRSVFFVSFELHINHYSTIKQAIFYNPHVRKKIKKVLFNLSSRLCYYPPCWWPLPVIHLKRQLMAGDFLHSPTFWHCLKMTQHQCDAQAEPVLSALHCSHLQRSPFFLFTQSYYTGWINCFPKLFHIQHLSSK